MIKLRLSEDTVANGEARVDRAIRQVAWHAADLDRQARRYASGYASSDAPESGGAADGARGARDSARDEGLLAAAHAAYAGHRWASEKEWQKVSGKGGGV